ncbi:MAG: hypothetical protein WD669_09230 [Pirellulales bacterium]
MSGGGPLFSDRAIQIVAENRIRAAMDAGEFDPPRRTRLRPAVAARP